MARVTYVKSAQQRYKTVPVLDDEGKPKKVALTRKDGSPKTTKTGRAITIRVTREDRSQPLPPRNCDHCHKPIEVGTPYKWVKTKTTYGGIRRNRHAGCPTWQPWDLSNSLSARIQQIQHEATAGEFETAEDARDAFTQAAESIRELASEKEDSASNMEDGFGHETEQSAELKDQAEQLEAWADEVEAAVESIEDPEEQDCETCGGTGEVGDNPEQDEATCSDCDGSGQVEDEDESWRDQVDEAQSILDQSPF